MNRDFVELLSAFIDHQVDHLVVGAHALAAHGHVRATKDLDVWIRPTPTKIDGVELDDAWSDRMKAGLGGLVAAVLS